MARAKHLQTKPLPGNRMASLLSEFIEWMHVSNSAAYTVYHRRASDRDVHPLGLFIPASKTRWK